MSPRFTSSSTSAPASRRGGDHPLEDRDAAAAEALVERRLRLDHRDVRRHRLDRGEREPLQPGDVVARAPRRAAATPCGSMPAQNGPRSRMAACTRAPNVIGSFRKTVIRFLQLGHQPGGGGGVVQQGGADLDGGRAGGEERAGVVGVRDPPAADDLRLRHLGAHLGDAAQRERPDRRAAQPAGPPVGQRGRQRVADHHGAGAGVERRCARSRPPGPRRSGAWPAPASRAAGRAGPRRRRSRRGTARGRRRPGYRWRRRGQVHLDPGDARATGRAAGPARRTPPATGRRSTRTCARPAAPATAARWPGSGRGRGSAGRSRCTSPDGVSTIRGAGPPGAGVDRDRAGDEAAERGQVAVRRELAAGAAAAGGDQHRAGQGEAGQLDRHRHRASRSSQRTRSPRNTGPSAQARTIRPTPSSPTTGTAQPWHSPVAQVIAASSAVWLQAPGRSAAVGDGVQGRGRAGGVDDLGARLLQHLVAARPGTSPRAADRAVAGDHGDRAGRAPGLERGQQVRLVRRRRRRRVTAQSRSRSRSASGKSGAAAYPSPTSTQLTGSFGSANGRPSGPVTVEPAARRGARPASGCRGRPARRPPRWWRRSHRWA